MIDARELVTQVLVHVRPEYIDETATFRERQAAVKRVLRWLDYKADADLPCYWPPGVTPKYYECTTRIAIRDRDALRCADEHAASQRGVVGHGADELERVLVGAEAGEAAELVGLPDGRGVRGTVGAGSGPDARAADAGRGE